MYEEILFHGTEIERGEKMLQWDNMMLSCGDKHWLGDGSYFYEDDFYAYKWIKDMYLNQFKKEPNPPKSLFDRYKILIGKIETNKDRIFNLDKPRNKMEFDRVYKNCEGMQKYSKRFSDAQLADGVILNIMFNDMSYAKEYDVVIASFKRRSNKYDNDPIRLNFMLEKQICVKNLGKATPIRFYECDDKIKEFQDCIDNLDQVSDIDQIITNNKVTTYNVKRDRKRFQK